MNAETKRYVIRHERAHQKRGDHWWKVIGYVPLVIYWFQPLMWIAYWIFARDIEYACDECVIGNLFFDKSKRCKWDGSRNTSGEYGGGQTIESRSIR